MKRRDRESWYLPSGSSRSRSSGGSTWTRVGLMVGLLLLVLGLMHRLSNPDFIQSAFRNLGAPLDESSSSSKASPSTSAGTAAEVDGGMEWVSPAGESAPDSGRSEPSLPPGSPMWLYAFRKGTPEIRRDLAEHFLAPTTSSTKFLELTQLWAQGLSHEFAQGNRFLEEGSLPTSSMETLQSWNKDWNEFQKTLALSSEEFSRSSTLAWSGFVHALDRALLDDIRDASPWRSHDRPALFRALFHAQQQSDRSVRTDLPLTPSVLLSNSADAYRGRWVRLQGTIAKSPTAEVLNDPILGTIAYHSLWVHPVDPSTQPICLYVSDLPRELRGLASAEESQPTATNQQPSDPILDFEGIFLKRLVYRSKRGLDIAPVLVVGPIALRDSSDMLSHRLAQEKKPEVFQQPYPSIPSWRPPFQGLQNAKRLDEILQPIAEPFKKNLDGLLSREIVGKEASLPNELLQTLYQLGRWNETVRWSESAGKSLGPWKATSFYGTARRVDRVALSAAAREWFGQSSVFRVEVESLAPQRSQVHTSVLWSSQVPAQWLGSKELSQPCYLQGLQWPSTTATPEAPSLVLCHKVEWKWDDEHVPSSFAPELGALWKSLGAFGVDLTAAERAKQYQKDRIHGNENESLMKLLDYGSVATETREWRKASRRPHSLGDLLREPDAHILQGFKGKVRILRAARIRLTDEGCPRELKGPATMSSTDWQTSGNQGQFVFNRNPTTLPRPYSKTSFPLRSSAGNYQPGF